jgi:hypothetical protein
MGRARALLIGLVAGILLSGIVVALLLPRVPDTWRSAPLVWVSAATVVAICVGAATMLSRPARR